MNIEEDERMRNVDRMQDKIIDSLGPEAALEEICKALTTSQKEDIFSFIIRMNDLDE